MTPEFSARRVHQVAPTAAARSDATRMRGEEEDGAGKQQDSVRSSEWARRVEDKSAKCYAA